MIWEPGSLASPHRTYYPPDIVYVGDEMRAYTRLHSDGVDPLAPSPIVGNSNTIGMVVASVIMNHANGRDISNFHYVVFPKGIGWVDSRNIEFW